MKEINLPKRAGLTGPGGKSKVVSAREAVQIIKDGDLVAVGGFGGIGAAEELLIALGERFDKTGHPKDLTLYTTAAVGDGRDRGVSRLGKEGMLKRVIAGHYGFQPGLGQLAMENKIEAYNLPQGILTQMLRDAAAKKPRTLTRVGLDTFVDPRFEGGKVNEKTTEDLVELMVIDGEDVLAFKPPAIDVAIIRGTTAEPNGNLSFEDEALTLDTLAMAMAAQNNGGVVIAQVTQIAEPGTLKQREVRIPGVLIDCISLAIDPSNHMQTYATPNDAAFSGKLRVPLSQAVPLPLDVRKIIARRAAFELIPNCVVNLGVGIPEGVANIAAEENLLDLITLTAEPGVIGGVPAGGMDFGAARNADAIIDMPYQFDFYDGGGMDIAFLGLAQADQEGNLNVSRFGPMLAGCGGFINISQPAGKVVFMGTFTAGGLKVQAEDGKLSIIKEGRSRKFIQAVEQVTFSGRLAAARKQPVLFVTERCVMDVTPKGLRLVEVAPGIDIQKDILAQMDFKPIIEGTPKPMDGRLFLPGPMELKREILSVPIEDRVFYDADQNILFINFENLSVRSMDEINEFRDIIRTLLDPLGKKVDVIINYDGFDLLPELMDNYLDTVGELGDRYYGKATRYTTSAFMRMKLGDSFKERGMAPHVYECAAEAHAALKRKMDN